MKSLIAIRHVHFEDLGSFADVFADAGYDSRYYDAGIDDLSSIDPIGADMIVVLGAPIGANDEKFYPFLTDELRLLRIRLAAKRPTLGICLGAQLMARSLGASVREGTAKEIGWHPVTLTPAGMTSPLKHLEDVPVLHWHGDTFTIPDGAVCLGSTPITMNQAFSLGTNALALQFHPEAQAKGFERWLVGHALEIASVPGLSVEQLRDDTNKYASGTAAKARNLLVDWLAGLSV